MNDRHPIALIALGELAKREQSGGGPAYLFLNDLAGETGLTTANLLRELADAVEARRVRVSAVEVTRAEA